MANEKDKQKQATSQKGTTYTQVNDSTYNWSAPTGYGVIHLDPNSGGPWGTYHVYQGKGVGPDVEKRFSRDGLAPHLQNIRTLEFKYPDPWWQPIKEYVAPRWNQLMDQAKIQKNGGWLTKYALGGEVPQQAQTEDRQLLALVTSAYKEVESGKLGESFIYVAQMLQDSQGAAKLDSLRTQIPELEEMLNAIEEVAFQQSAYMKRGGCAKKKKVKKGAKGCVPCKKLMKIGGRLVNVLTDCEGNIISKHQTGGWILKAETGTELLERQRQALIQKRGIDWLNKQDHTVTANQKYYVGTDGKLYQATGKLTNGTWSWDTSGSAIEGAVNKNGTWSINGKAVTAVAQNALGNDYYTGATHQIYDPTTGKYFNYSANGTGWTKGAEATADDFTREDYYEGTDMTNWTISPEKAKEHGIDASAFAGPRPKERGVYGDAPNSLLGLEARDPDGTDYINQFGVQGAWTRENSIMQGKFNEAWRDRRTALQSARQSRKDKNTDNDVTRASVIDGYNSYKTKLNTERSNHAAAISDAIRAKWAGFDPGVYATQTKEKAQGDTDLLVGAKSTVQKSAKGGWISKFDNGGKNSDLIQAAARNSEWSGYNLPYEAYSFAKNGKLDKANIQFTKIGDRSYEWTVPGTNGAYDMYTASRDAASLPWDIKKMSYTGLLPAQPVITHYYAAIPYTYPPTGGYFPKESPALFMNYMAPVKM